MANFSRIWGGTTTQTLGPAYKAVRLATAAALPACTPAGTGVGHTLTADAVGILTVDGVAVVATDRILVKDQVAADDNGIYLCTTEGTAGVAFILTRATDFDAASAGEIAKGEGALVSAGTANAGTSWVLTTTGTITVDTTNLTFAQAGGADNEIASSPISTFRNNTLGVVIAVTEVQAPLVGYIEVQVGNGEPKPGISEPRADITWRAYKALSTVGGSAITDGQLDVSGSTDFELDLQNLPFGWLRLYWVGDTGTGTISTTLTARGAT